MEELVGPREIQQMLGVGRTRLAQFTKDPDYAFPAPVATLAKTRVWRAEDVREWARSRGRAIADTDTVGHTKPAR